MCHPSLYTVFHAHNDNGHYLNMLAISTKCIVELKLTGMVLQVFGH